MTAAACAASARAGHARLQPSQLLTKKVGQGGLRLEKLGPDEERIPIALESGDPVFRRRSSDIPGFREAAVHPARASLLAEHSVLRSFCQ